MIGSLNLRRRKTTTVVRHPTTKVGIRQGMMSRLLVVDGLQCRNDKSPSDALLRARRALDGLTFYELVEDWLWNESAKKWALRCRLTVQPAGFIPDKTDWFIVADDDYPWGEAELHPAKDGGIVSTFPHQLYNSRGNPDVPWRDGKICSQTSMRYSGRRAYDIEPISIDERLWWLVTRTKAWLEAAAAGRLAEKNEPFELPHFPRGVSAVIGFIENRDSLHFWQGQPVTYGIATTVQPKGVERWTAVTIFMDAQKRPIRTVEYGSMLSHESVRKATAMWIRLPGVPVLEPWQAPTTFGELRSAMTEQGVDFDELVISLAPALLDGKQHFLLLGFPIPDVIGGEYESYHWQALELPILAHSKLKRHKKANFSRHDARCRLADSIRINWVTSRNWSEEQIRTRGRLSNGLTMVKVLLVGGGAMGSSVAELLVREGCQQLTVIDGDILEIGNLCRHTLSLRDMQMPKADALADRLSGLSPHVTVESITTEFHNSAKTERQLMAECDVIIDCSGDDRVAYQLSTFPWVGDKLFVSVSMGLRAQRLFIFGAQAENFPHGDFMRKLAPWLEKELEDNKGFELPREGIGCWHPVFPARADDVWLMSSFAVKCIDAWAINPPRSPNMGVYEQEWRDGFPVAIKLVDYS